MLSDKFCGPRDAVRGQLDGVVELPSTPTVKFVDQVRKMVETASDYNDVALALRAAVAVDPERIKDVAAAVAAKAHDASERELESASTKALDDLAASTESDDAQALRTAPTNADVALRRAAWSSSAAPSPVVCRGKVDQAPAPLARG